jgi:hypothetical protein
MCAAPPPKSQWREADAEARANLTIEGMDLTIGEQALFEMLRAEAVPSSPRPSSSSCSIILTPTGAPITPLARLKNLERGLTLSLRRSGAILLAGAAACLVAGPASAADTPPACPVTDTLQRCRHYLHAPARRGTGRPLPARTPDGLPGEGALDNCATVGG